jgi:hypothetical protein
LEEQETAEGKKHDRQSNLSTQGSGTQPGSKRSPIQENISDSNSESGQKLAKSLELHIGTTPTLDKSQIAISYAATVTKTSTAQGHGGTTPFSTVDMTGGTPDWSTNSRGYQTIQGGRSGQTESTDLGQGAPNWPTAGQTGLGPFGRPDPTIASENIPGGSQSTQQQIPPPVQQ